ncbi:MAG: hypothetical protein ACOYPS_13135 [Phycisphaerales bacterium]
MLKKEKRMSKKVMVEIDVQSVIDAAQEAFNGPDAQEIADELFERVVDKIESNLDMSALAMELDLGDIAQEIDVSELAEEIELDELAERVADKVQHKLPRNLDMRSAVEGVVESMVDGQLADMRAEIAHLDLERRTLRSAVEDLRAEVEALKAPLAALRPLLKLMEALKS